MSWVATTQLNAKRIDLIHQFIGKAVVIGAPRHRTVQLCLLKERDSRLASSSANLITFLF